MWFIHHLQNLMNCLLLNCPKLQLIIILLKKLIWKLLVLYLTKLQILFPHLQNKVLLKWKLITWKQTVQKLKEVMLKPLQWTLLMTRVLILLSLMLLFGIWLRVQMPQILQIIPLILLLTQPMIYSLFWTKSLLARRNLL